MVSTVQTSVAQYWKNIRNTVVSTFEGMSVTMSWMFRRPMTIQYPDKIEKPIQETLPEQYRGVLEVDLGICTGCGLCMKTCPIGCIAIETGKIPETNERTVNRFDIYIARCMFCGLCSEPCPTGAIHHTREFEVAEYHLDDHLLKWVQGPPTPVYKVKKDVEPPARPPHGAILGEVKRRLHSGEMAPGGAAPAAKPAPDAAPAAKPAPLHGPSQPGPAGSTPGGEEVK